MKRRAILSALGAVMLGTWCACQYPTHLPPLDVGLVDVHLVGSEPIRGATIDVWALDAEGKPMGQPWATCEPGAECETGEGRYLIEVGDLVPPYLVTARGGMTGEFWADDEFVLREQVHMQAVVTRWIQRQTGAVVVSPLTTLAKELAARRFELGMEPAYVDAASRAREIIGAHFDIDPVRTVPASRMDASMTEDVRHALALLGLSSIVAEFAERSPASTESMNIVALTDALVSDVQGPGATLDGIGPVGPVELDSCWPAPCLLTADTLRHELARNLLQRFLRSPWNVTGLDYGDVGEWLGGVTDNAEPELFPGPSMETLDQGSPVILVLPSLVADERLDTITFDDNFAPIHEHSTEASDLAQGFGGADCPVVYKHVNTAKDPMDNPIRFRFAVLDDVVGTSADGIRVVVRADGAAESFAVAARSAAWVTGGMEYEATITRADVPRLADTEGRFLIEIQATDWVGHESVVMRGCWEHRPLSAQPWVGQATVATGPDSLQAVGLEPVNNLAPLLNGVAVDQGKAVMEFEVRNGTDDPIYLTLDYAQPVATYRKDWIETYTELYTSNVPDSTCLLTPVTCPLVPPAVDTGPKGDDGMLADLVGGVRVWELHPGGTTIEIPPCQGCEVNEYRLEPRRGPSEPRVFRVALVVTNLAELAPRQDFEPPAIYQDTTIDPTYEPTEITGLLLDTLRKCETPDFSGTTCLTHIVYRSYRALTRAIITLDVLTVVGRLSAKESLSTYQPLPQANTFGLPSRIEAVQWISNEGSLPMP